MACSGHTSAQARHLLQSASVVSPAAMSCRLMPSGQARTHRSHEAPRDSARHFSALRCGRKVRLSPLMRESRAPKGQNFAHQRGNRITSAAMSAIKAMMVQVVSPKANRRMTRSTVAKVRPTGHTRQNTGKPNTSVLPRAAARMP